MDQRFQQAQLKLPQAQVSAVSHNPGKINYQFFFSLQWKKVVTRHKSDLIFRKRSTGRVLASKAVNPSHPYLPQQSKPGWQPRSKPICRGHNLPGHPTQTDTGKERKKTRKKLLPSAPEAACSPSHPSASLLAWQLPFMPCQPPGHSSRCRAWSCSLPCQSWGTAEGSASP